MLRRIIYPLAKLLLVLIFLVLGPLRVYGRSNVPRKGGLLILCNHISDADPPAIGHAAPRWVHFMAKSELFEIKFLGPLIRALGAFPVKRGEPDRAAIRRTVDLLRGGEAVVMFPEGECSETGVLQPILPGAALVARTAGTPVICAGFVGTDRILPYGKVWPRPAFGGVSVRFGAPRLFNRNADLDEIVRWIGQELAHLTTPA